MVVWVDSTQLSAQLNSARLASTRFSLNKCGWFCFKRKVKKRRLFPSFTKRDTHRKRKRKKLLYQITKRLKLYNNRIVKQTEASSFSSCFIEVFRYVIVPFKTLSFVRHRTVHALPPIPPFVKQFFFFERGKKLPQSYVLALATIMFDILYSQLPVCTSKFVCYSK